MNNCQESVRTSGTHGRQLYTHLGDFWLGGCSQHVLECTYDESSDACDKKEAARACHAQVTLTSHNVARKKEGQQSININQVSDLHNLVDSSTIRSTGVVT